MTKPLKLVYPTSSLNIWVVSGTNGSHAGGFVASVGLGTVLEVGIGATRAVNTYVSGGGDVGAAVGLGHDCDDGDAGGGADGLGSEAREEGVSVGVGDGGDHLDELGGAGEAVLAAGSGLEGVEVDAVAAAGELHHAVHDLGDGSDAGLLFREVVGENAAATRSRGLPGIRRHRHGTMEESRG